VTIKSGTRNHNSWLDTASNRTSLTTALETDFLTTDTTGISGPRKSDGSLPDITFMHLVPGSHFVDAGTDVGLPFSGMRPDLGCFETKSPSTVPEIHGARILDFQLSQNFPNPFNPATVISYQLSVVTYVNLSVFDVLGRKVATLVDEKKAAGTYSVRWNAEAMPSGIYFYQLAARDYSQVRKMALVK